MNCQISGISYSPEPKGPEPRSVSKHLFITLVTHIIALAAIHAICRKAPD